MKRFRKVFSSHSSSDSDNSPLRKVTVMESNYEGEGAASPQYTNMAEQYSPEPIPTWAQGLMADMKELHTKMDDLSDSVNGIKTKIVDLQSSVENAHQTANEGKQKAESALQKIQGVEISTLKLKHDYDILQGRLDSLNEYILKIECQSRRSNLKIDNVPEVYKESPKLTENIFRDILRKMGHNNANTVKIERCHRMGHRGQQPRTIIIKFNWYGDRDDIWENRWRLRGSGFVLKEDYPSVYEERRRILLPHFFAAKNDKAKFGKVDIVVDKLLVKGRLYTVDQLNELPDGLRPDQICTRSANGFTLFFGRQSIFSNFYPAKFKVDNTDYNCSEQFYQVRKAEFYNDEQSAAKIMATDDPANHYKLGKEIKGYAENKARWFSGPALRAMEKAVCEKFKQNPQLETALKSSQGLLVEASKSDDFWGIGLGINHKQATTKSMWKGQNKLGSLLTALRDAM